MGLVCVQYSRFLLIQTPINGFPISFTFDDSTKEKDLADKKPNTGALQWTQSELEQLNDVCVECEDTSNFVESVIEEMRNLGNVKVSFSALNNSDIFMSSIVGRVTSTDN